MRSRFPRKFAPFSARAIADRTMLTRVLLLGARRSDRFSNRKRRFLSLQQQITQRAEVNSTPRLLSVLRCARRGDLRQLVASDEYV